MLRIIVAFNVNRVTENLMNTITKMHICKCGHFLLSLICHSQSQMSCGR